MTDPTPRPSELKLLTMNLASLQLGGCWCAYMARCARSVPYSVLPRLLCACTSLGWLRHAPGMNASGTHAVLFRKISEL